MKRRLMFVLLLLVAATMNPPQVQAQVSSVDALSTEIGGLQYVRIYGSFGMMDGRFIGANSRAVAVTDSRGEPIEILPENIDSVFIRVSGSANLAKKSALFGALSLGILGGLVHSGFDDEGGFPAGGILIGGAIGAGSGGLLGYIIGQGSTKWRQVFPSGR